MSFRLFLSLFVVSMSVLSLQLIISSQLKKEEETKDVPTIIFLKIKVIMRSLSSL